MIFVSRQHGQRSQVVSGDGLIARAKSSLHAADDVVTMRGGEEAGHVFEPASRRVVVVTLHHFVDRGIRSEKAEGAAGLSLVAALAVEDAHGRRELLRLPRRIARQDLERHLVRLHGDLGARGLRVVDDAPRPRRQTVGARFVEAEPVVQLQIDRGWLLAEDGHAPQPAADEAGAGAEVIQQRIADAFVRLEAELVDGQSAAAVVSGVVHDEALRDRAGEFELNRNHLARSEPRVIARDAQRERDRNGARRRRRRLLTRLRGASVKDEDEAESDRGCAHRDLWTPFRSRWLAGAL